LYFEGFDLSSLERLTVWNFVEDFQANLKGIFFAPQIQAFAKDVLQKNK
jgi:hypothetical protein